ENIYKSLDSVEKKRDLLFKFWYQQEKEHPGLREEYYERVAYANEFYAFANVPGWKSDRGRVYIVYGKPTRVEQFPNGPNHRPFEIWYYDQLEGGSRFYFVDNTGFGDYRLVTSTYRGEVYDPGWEEQIQDWLRYNPSYDADIY
ncbi:MAG: GWxTD domain-containing protein, partial [Methanobacteriota archaeon]